MNVDECGAPEAIAGVKLLVAETRGRQADAGRSCGAADRAGRRRARRPAAACVSITQCTELGTLYTRRRDPRARRARARARPAACTSTARGSPTPPPRSACRCGELAAGAGVDIVSFGGTKNGLLGGEAVVILDPELGRGFQYLRKQSLQLASKMRFLAAQFDALLERRAVAAVRRPRKRDGGAARRSGARRPGSTITRPVQTNAVFATLPRRRRRPRCRSGSRSTSGTKRPARCAGCARGTRPRTT